MFINTEMTVKSRVIDFIDLLVLNRSVLTIVERVEAY